MSKDAKPDAWMPLYIGDWDGDTGHLDCEQDGAYGRMVRWYWRNGPLPDDDASIARIIRMELRQWRKIRSSLAGYFEIGGGVWRHGRVEKELVRWAEKRAKAIERAAAGGRAKAAKSTATSTPQALLAGCTSASAREVDGPTDQSTLSAKVSILGSKESLDTEREWAIDKTRAEAELVLARRQDPDLASELEEFIDTAKNRIAELRRARLSVVAA